MLDLILLFPYINKHDKDSVLLYGITAQHVNLIPSLETGFNKNYAACMASTWESIEDIFISMFAGNSNEYYFMHSKYLE